MHSIPRLRIRDEFHEKSAQESILRVFVVKHSMEHTRPLTYDITGLIENSPHKPYSICFYLHFFEQILGENTVYKNSNKMFSSRHTGTQTNYYFRRLHTFLNDYTNIEEVIDAFINRINSISPEETYLISDYKNAQFYWFLYEYCRINYDKDKLNKGVFLSDGSVLIISSIKKIMDIALTDPVQSFVVMKQMTPVFKRDIDGFAEEHNSYQKKKKYIHTVSL